MKFETDSIVFEEVIDRVTPEGARLGDQIMWSKHNKANATMPTYLTTNKLYTVREIWGTTNLIAVITSDAGGDSSWTGGEYDIIIKAVAQPTVAPPFPKSSLYFESYNDLDYMVNILGETKADKPGAVSMSIWNEMKNLRDRCYDNGIR